MVVSSRSNAVKNSVSARENDLSDGAPCAFR
ncbi:Uncharacterised protein [Mycobacteroides abscessus subsp. abscessus]|nr:Uncharacterised protein [Mycobacteroides abscessus subsp. abscessus]